MFRSGASPFPLALSPKITCLLPASLALPYPALRRSTNHSPKGEQAFILHDHRHAQPLHPPAPSSGSTTAFSFRAYLAKTKSSPRTWALETPGCPHGLSVLSFSPPPPKPETRRFRENGHHHTPSARLHIPPSPPSGRVNKRIKYSFPVPRHPPPASTPRKTPLAPPRAGLLGIEPLGVSVWCACFCHLIPQDSGFCPVFYDPGYGGHRPPTPSHHPLGGRARDRSVPGLSLAQPRTGGAFRA